jgi:ComF family protein
MFKSIFTLSNNLGRQLSYRFQQGGGQLLELLIPCPCLLCGSIKMASELSPLICRYCHQQLPRLDLHPHLCQCCSLPLATDAPFCGQCLNHPPAFSGSRIPFSYGHPIDALIQRFKYQQQLSSGRLLAALMGEQIAQQAALPMPSLLIPVPIYWRRRWRRGFNQTEILARYLGQQFNLEVLNACRSPLPTHSQQGLSRSERLKNLRRAFELIPSAKAKIQRAHIALVDDVVTTTATARCLSELLLKQGAQRVDIWALARTPEH